jgi:AraC-like DNA-binding protein
MSYDSLLLFTKVAACLFENPRQTLEEMSDNLHVGKRTIQHTVRVSVGRSFKHFREEVLLTEAKRLLTERPEMAIKELSFQLGFRSATSFARAVKRTSGLSPVQIRSIVSQGYPIPEIIALSGHTSHESQDGTVTRSSVAFVQ